MPRINDNALQSVVYLYESEAEAEAGDKLGATGFLLMIPYSYLGAWIFHVYVVTNAHVIEDMKSNIREIKGKCIAVRINTRKDKPYIYLTGSANWVFHSQNDDLAVCYLNIDYDTREELDWICIPRNMLLSKDTMYEYNVGVGTDVYIVGRFNNHAGLLSNKPTVRIGHIALNADEKEKVSQRKSRGIDHDQESFILNCRSDGGFSGSPVFVELFSSADGIKMILRAYFEMIQTIKTDLESLAITAAFNSQQPEQFQRILLSTLNRNEEINKNLEQTYEKLGTRLLGINWGHYPVNNSNTDNTGFSCAVPAWKLDELLDDPRLVDERKQIEEKFHKDFDSYLSSNGAVSDGNNSE